jgi:hypothetical protein
MERKIDPLWISKIDTPHLPGPPQFSKPLKKPYIFTARILIDQNELFVEIKKTVTSSLHMDMPVNCFLAA